jgi:translation initiation factor 3 subunit C
VYLFIYLFIIGYQITTKHLNFKLLLLSTMSRFFRQAGDSDSDSEESDEELLISDGEEKTISTTAKPALSRFRKSAGKDSSSSSESSDEGEDDDSDDEDKKSSEGGENDEEAKQVVKSAQDKRLEAMETTGKVIDNALKINDWVAISNGMVFRSIMVLLHRRPTQL